MVERMHMSGASRASLAIRWHFVYTVPEPNVSAMWPSSGAMIRPPLPSTGSAGARSPASRVL